MFNARAEYNGFARSHDFNAGRLHYDATLHLTVRRTQRCGQISASALAIRRVPPKGGLFFDASVAYGRPHLDFDVPPAIVTEAGQANVNAEEQQLRDKIDRYRFYPIIKIGATYRF